MEHSQHKICHSVSKHPDIIVRDGCIYYNEIETKKSDDKTELWELQIQCFDVNGREIEITTDNCDDLLLSKYVARAEINILEISVTGKQHQEQAPVAIDQGKNIGKKNETTILEEAFIVCDKKYENMCKKKTSTCSILPMLLNTFAYATITDGSVELKEIQHTIKYPEFAQRKLDGLRCVAVEKGLFSRGEEQFLNVSAIEANIVVIEEHLQQKYKKIRVNIDGELYIHGETLENMNRIVRNGSTNTSNLLYNIFDVDCIDLAETEIAGKDIEAPVIFNDRLQLLLDIRTLIEELKIKNIKVVDTFIVNCENELKELLEEVVENEGYEGIVLRNPTGLYEYSINGKRSKDVLRCKPRHDMEVFVESYCEGNGKDTGAIIWICEYEGHTFNVVQNASLEQRIKQFSYFENNPEYFQIVKEMPLEIEYNETSEDGIPLESRAVIFRHDKSDANIAHIEEDLFDMNLI